MPRWRWRNRRRPPPSRNPHAKLTDAVAPARSGARKATDAAGRARPGFDAGPNRCTLPARPWQ
jgi:hypothetical protein